MLEVPIFNQLRFEMKWLCYWLSNDFCTVLYFLEPEFGKIYLFIKLACPLEIFEFC